MKESARKTNAASSEPQIDEQRREELNRRQTRLDRFLKAVGPRYVNSTFDTYQICHGHAQERVVERLRRYCSELPARFADGQSVVLFGLPGTGKDHLAAAVARIAITAYGRTVVWQNGPSLGAEFRTAMRRHDESALVDRLASPHLLYLSDPGARGREAMTDFVATSLFSVIDARYRARKPTLVTLNTETPAEAEFRLGAPVADRLRDRSLRLWCDWPSWRQREETLFEE